MFEKHVAAVLRDSRAVKKGEYFLSGPGVRLTISAQGGEYGFLDIGTLLLYASLLFLSFRRTTAHGYENNNA